MAECQVFYPDTFYSKTLHVSGVIYIFYVPVIVGTNALLIMSLIATKQSMKNTSNFLIACLSTSDILIGQLLVGES